ncbi:hypothetical protein ZYGR_0H04600 [Zygosaccharomyces rouxii]|uniref:ZYRO0B14630p n=2 Tax=Zygosaccharomyces rouxii TaxID=4956 RepID=C5DS81_ZYGRC|nr:uncharacterized protein ZYRO0B14630g [Zygosaccharomyces rouxii]KAH9199829.1 hypothetical protein LQ764DRAFT_234443 [Zygosaccharomyces rouxii]GAV47614.1 hypothetical protein ZYGR_0H04600 [Zygosaccharomyces rouxii]CAR26642.1 ZYRO0B14630p [Zygosaccharomyces rouxii]
MDEAATKAEKGQKLFPHKFHRLSFGKKEAAKFSEKNEQGLAQKAMDDYGKDVLDDSRASIKSPRKSGGFSSFRSPRLSFSSKNGNKLPPQTHFSGGNEAHSDSGNDAKPQDIPSVKSRQSSKKPDSIRRSSMHSRQSGRVSSDRADIGSPGTRIPSHPLPKHLLVQQKEKEEQEAKRKQLTPSTSEKQQLSPRQQQQQEQQQESLKNKVPPTTTGRLNTPEELFPWKKIGSFHHTGKGSPNTGDARLVKAYILENLVNDWYNNAAVLVGTCFISWSFAYLRFSWWSLLFVLGCMGAVFASEYRRFNRNVRDDLTRITVEETLSQRKESVLWMNSFLSKFWVLYMPILSQQVKDIVNPALAGVAPGYGIDALSLDEFTLGSKAPSVRSISSNTKAGADVSEMVFEFAFTPSDVSEMTPKEAKNKIHPKIVLAISLGKSVVSKKMKVIVEDINVSGRMRAKIKFGDTFPNIGMVSVQMLEPPVIEFGLKPLGGDTLGLDVMSFLPGLKKFVQTIINANVGPMLYAPNHFDINVEELMAAQVNDAIGVLAVTIANGNDLKGSDFITNTVDPYISFELEKPLPDLNGEDLRTTIKHNTTTPRWNETKYVLVSSLQQKMKMKCFDFNDVRKDTFIGEIEIDLNDLLQEPTQDNLSTDLTIGTKSRGALNYSLHWFPAKKSENITGQKETGSDEEASSKQGTVAIPDGAENNGKVEDDAEFKEKEKETENGEEDEERAALDEDNEDEETDAGIVKLTLQNIKYLNTAVALTGTLSPSATLFLNGNVVKEFRTLKRINEPSWGETIELFIPSREESELRLEVYDNGLREKKLICEYGSTLEDIFENLQNGEPFVKGSPQGEIYMNAEWKPVKMSGLFASGGSRDPLGALRVLVRDINVLDNLSGLGDIDPYFTLSVNRHVDYKSISYSETEHAYFDKVDYLILMSEKASVTVNVYDYQSVGDDRFIGSAQIPLEEVMKKDPKTDKFTLVDNSKKPLKLGLQNKKGKIGQNYVNVSLSFVPCIPVYTPNEYQTVLEKDAELQQQRKEFWQKQDELKKEMEKTPDQYEIINKQDPFEEEEKKLHKKERLSLEQLLQHNSGVLNLQLLGGTIHQSNCFLQICVDDLSWPKYTSPKIYNDSFPSDGTDVFIRDLRNSKLLFRLTDKRVPKNESNIITEFTCNTYDLLQSSYGEVSKVNIGGSVVNVQCLYTPTSQKLPVSDTVLDTGTLNLTVFSAEDLMSADRNGYSDPFFTIVVDHRELYKSEIVKKTLSPEWNEKTEVPIPSRTRKKVQVFFYDWDRAGDNDELGLVELDLFPMMPNEVYNWELPLNTQGKAKFQAVFIPQYNKPMVTLNEVKKKSAVGHLASAPSGVGHAGKGIVHGGAHLFRKPFKAGKRKSTDLDSTTPNRKSTAGDSIEDGPSELSPELANAKKSLDVDRSVPNLDYALVQELDPKSHLPVGGDDLSARLSNHVPSVLSGPVERKSFSKDRGDGIHKNLQPGTNYQGQLTLISTDRVAPKLQLNIGLSVNGKVKHLYKSKTQKEDEGGNATFNESFAFRGPPEGSLVFEAISHHRLTKDIELGIAEIPLNDPQIQIGGNINLNLGEGTVVFRTDYGTPIDDSVPPVPPIPHEYQ